MYRPTPVTAWAMYMVPAEWTETTPTNAQNEMFRMPSCYVAL